MQREPIAYRMAVPADAVCIAALATQVFLDTYAADGVRPDLAREAFAVYSPAAFDARLRDASRRFQLAERAGHLLAFSECGNTGDLPLAALRGGLELVRLYVQRPAQGLGLGRTLLAMAEAHAATAGHRTLWLTAWAGNARARAFYEAQGYRDVGTTNYVFEGQAYENRVYSKTLAAPDHHAAAA